MLGALAFLQEDFEDHITYNDESTEPDKFLELDVQVRPVAPGSTTSAGTFLTL